MKPGTPPGGLAQADGILSQLSNVGLRFITPNARLGPMNSGLMIPDQTYPRDLLTRPRGLMLASRRPHRAAWSET